MAIAHLAPAGSAQPDGSGAMFDRIARRYDLLNRLLSLGLDRRWRRLQVEALAPLAGSARVLDLATGTADVAIAVARRYPGVTVTGVDPSAGMLAIARRKVLGAGLDDRISLVTGDAQALPFANDSFDATCMSFGIRNVPDRALALRQMARVTRPMGKVLILELSEPGPGVVTSLARLYVHAVVPTLGALVAGAHEYRYLQRSIAAFPPAAAFAESMEAAGLTMVGITSLSFGAAHLFVAQRLSAA
jgi:demethylmenaquinone methyltransferase/2-methoxy-6-polyprenyl-1,4-benzoquinol methylase